MLVRTFIALAASSASAFASDIVVQPGNSIQAAINVASNGDRILLQSGTYHEVIDLHGKLLQVVGVMGAASTTIDGTGLNESVVTVTSGEPVGTMLTGITIRGGRGHASGNDIAGGGVIVAGTGTNLRLVDCVIANNGNSNTVFAGGVYAGFGAHVELSRCIVRNNRAVVGSAAYVDWNGATLSLEQCTLYGHPSSQSAIGHHDAVSVSLNSCIMWGNNSLSIAEHIGQNPSATITVKFSVVDGGWPGIGNIAAPPQFISDSILMPAPGSPCIDAGDPSLPLDADGTRADMGAVPFDPDPHTPTIAYCSGDGTSAACPCGVSLQESGCPNSIALSGAHLASTGFAGTTYDTFKLVATDVPNGPGLYFQATGTTDLPFFGDGKFCAGVGIVRLGVTFAAGNMSSYPDAVLTTPIHTAGSIPGAGGTRYYQAWYRDTDPAFCTPSLFNLTNGLSVAWVP